MSQELDDKLGVLLRAGAPPERDPAFRIAVLERQQLQRYRRRLRLHISVTVAALLAPLLIYPLVTGIPAASLLRGTLVVTLIGGVLAAAVFSLRGMRQAVRWMKRG